MKVRFPMYFEVVGYQEIDLPADIDTENEDAIKEYIKDKWHNIPLPKMEDVEFVDGTCNFDSEAIVEVME